MRQKTKNTISVILPIVSIFIIAFAFRMGPTGLAVYEDKMMYRINGSVSIDLHEKIPADSYVRVKIDYYEVKISIVEFLNKAGEGYNISDGFIIGNDTYKVDFDSLGIIQGFEKGRYTIKTDVVYEDSILYSDKGVIEV